MPRVVEKRPGRVPSPTYRYAYLMERNGTWYAVCHDRRRSTGYKAFNRTRLELKRPLRIALLVLPYLSIAPDWN